MGRISEVSLREEPLNSAGKFINVRIRISEASFTRQSCAMWPVPGRLRGSLLEEGTNGCSRKLIGADFLQRYYYLGANKDSSSVSNFGNSKIRNHELKEAKN